MKRIYRLVLAASFCSMASVVCAQGAAPENPQQAAAQSDPESGSTAEVVALPSDEEVIDVDAIKLPSMSFALAAEDEKDFDKYYYFHRDNTEFKAALSDLRDCDGLARGLASPYGYTQAPYASSMAGAVGGMIGNLMVAAIFGSAQVRAARRINMRRCMNYKEYDRYGIPKNIWQDFNFEEGFGALEEKKRQVFLKQQAKVASGAKPTSKILGK